MKAKKTGRDVETVQSNLVKIKERISRQKRNHTRSISSNNRNINHPSNNQYQCSIWRERANWEITESKRFS